MNSHATRPRAERVVTIAMAAMLLALGSAHVAAESSATAPDDTYSWSAELVALDAGTGLATLKAPVVTYQTGDQWAFEKGDPIDLLWSGSGTHASGIRRVTRAGERGAGPFVMPAEFAGQDGRYVSFTVTIPADQIARIASLEPGEWVTVTTRHAPSDPSKLVASVRAYTDIG